MLVRPPINVSHTRNLNDVIVVQEALGPFIWRRAGPLNGLELFLQRSHLIPNPNTKFYFCSYKQAGWPAKRDFTGVLAPRIKCRYCSCAAYLNNGHVSHF